MTRRIVYLLFAVAVLAICGCKRRPLVDMENMHYVRVYLDEELLNVTTGFYDESRRKPAYKRPDIMRVALFDPITGTVASERYLRGRGRDERGSYCDGYIFAAPGDYRLLTYNFGTESTLLRRENDYAGVEAYTNEIATHLYNLLPSRADGSDGERIVYMPDHLFAAGEQVHIPYTGHVDTLKPPISLLLIWCIYPIRDM